jgi:hypothetical protein
VKSIGWFLVALGLTAFAFAASPAIAHGGHAHPSQPAAGAADASERADSARVEAPALMAPSQCPSDGDGACCCHGDRCTNPSQPRLCAPSAPRAEAQRALSPERPRVAGHPIAVAHAHPVGAVGSRGPPVNSRR